MKINKEFVKLLTEEKLTMVFELLGRDGLGMIIADRKTLKSLDDLDEIFYTSDFLEREKMIIVKQSGNTKAPHVGDCLQEDIKDSGKFIRHLMDTNDKLKEFYTKEIKTNFTIYDFVKNGYKTDLQKEKDRNLWLPIGVAIGTIVGVSFLTVLFEKIFLFNQKII